MFETMIQVKRNSRLGYSNSKRGEKETSNRRIRYTKKLENNGWADILGSDTPKDK